MIERIAGRFAAKEAILKALGTGLGDGASWRDIEILPDDKGAPHARYTGAVADKIAALATRIPASHVGATLTTRCHLSISHQGDYAVAFVVLELAPDVARAVPH